MLVYQLYQYRQKLQEWMKIKIKIVPGAIGSDRGALLSGTLGRIGWFVGGV